MTQRHSDLHDRRGRVLAGSKVPRPGDGEVPERVHADARHPVRPADERKSSVTQVPVEFYIYFGLMVLMSVAGVFYQCKLYREMKEDQDESKEDYYRKK